MKLTVIIVTIDRPDCVRRCLEHLDAQTQSVWQIIVVDGSAEQTARDVCESFPRCEYVQNPNGFGRMTGSRNLGLLHATGDVVAYLDDDAYAAPEWAERLVELYADPDVGAVGGRALNNGRSEFNAPEAIGRIQGDGQVTGGFATEVDEPIEVDHLIGCNMSFRREVIARLGGFHEFYPGHTCTYEEADLCMRIKSAGHRLLFAPRAVVNHVPAARRVGKRFDARYVYGVTRNHCTLLMRNWGPWRVVVWILPVRLGWGMSRVLFVRAAKEIAKLALKFGAVWAGGAIGVFGGLWQRRRQGANLIRDDDMGRRIIATSAASGTLKETNVSVPSTIEPSIRPTPVEGA